MNNNIPCVSVIVPVYNSLDYIKKCAETLLNQTLKNIEIIFVVDNPTDGTDKYINKIAESDSRIIVLENSSNLHVGLSRNRGLKIAKGEYIGFSDHDDWQDIYKYENLYLAAKKNDADIVIGTPCYVDEINKISRSYPVPEIDEVSLRNKLIELLIGDNYDDSKWNFFKTHGVIWDKIYKRSLISNNNISFTDTKIFTYEDNLFSLETLIASKKVISIKDIVYYHRIDDKNTSGTYSYSDIYKVIKYLHRINNILEECKLNYSDRLSHSILTYILFSLSRAYSSKGLKYYLKAILYIRKDSFIVKPFKIDYKYISKACKLTNLGKIKVWLTKTMITILN